LDKFLISKDNVPNSWRIKDNPNALNYQLRISMPNYNRDLEEIKQGVKIITDNSENTLYYKGDILLQIIAKQNELIQFIEPFLDEFFVLHSFGKRQNKGFGCFYRKSMDFENDVKPLLIKKDCYLYSNPVRVLEFIHGFRNNYKFYIEISDKWRILKSGLNHNGYIKSSVFKYLANNNIRWDKRWIKKELNAAGKALLSSTFDAPNDCERKVYTARNDNEQQGFHGWEDNDLDYPYRFGRAMLGLAEHYEFRGMRGYSYLVKVKCTDKDIQRYKAPVTFKVFDNKIFAIAEKQELFDKEFFFEVKVKRNNEEEETICFRDYPDSHKILKTPSAVEWNLVKFLNEYFLSVNFEKLK
jgi:hypothetical protein